jgi:RNA polymerase sigma-70 factor (ECF subfamily)
MPGIEFHQWIESGELRRAGQWLVRQYATDVHGLCTAIVRDRTAAEDLTQDSFSRALASLAGFRGEASVRTWLLTITRNQCIDYLRARDRDPWKHADSVELDDQADDAPLPAELLSNHAEVEAALASLDEGERALVVLRFRQGLDYSELAEASGLREGTVRMRVSRALARMRRALSGPERNAISAGAVADIAPPAPRMSRNADAPSSTTRSAASLFDSLRSRLGGDLSEQALEAEELPVAFEKALRAVVPEPTRALLDRLFRLASR